MAAREMIIDKTESRDGYDVVRCPNTLEKLGYSFMVGRTRYWMPIDKVEERLEKFKQMTEEEANKAIAELRKRLGI
jgi:hypothetical protein